MLAPVQVSSSHPHVCQGAAAEEEMGHLGDLITVDELDIVERAILKYVQSTTFPSIGTQWKSSSIAKLKPFRDPTKVLRVGGQLDKALIQFEARHPAILPRNHHLTCLIVYHYHLPPRTCRHRTSTH